MNDQMIEKWVQYTHLDKIYGHLPGMADAQPTVFGMSAAEHEEICAPVAARAEAAARDLLTEPPFAADVDALPFTHSQTVLAVGDSITDGPCAAGWPRPVPGTSRRARGRG